MSKLEKLIDKFLNNPSTIRYGQLVTILNHFGFTEIKAKGSHVKFKHPQLAQDLIIPVHNNDCKDFYKNLAKKQVEKIK